MKTEGTKSKQYISFRSFSDVWNEFGNSSIRQKNHIPANSPENLV